jgi:hypothetical protein
MDQYGNLAKKKEAIHKKCKELIPRLINNIRLVKLGEKALFSSRRLVGD